MIGEYDGIATLDKGADRQTLADGLHDVRLDSEVTSDSIVRRPKTVVVHMMNASDSSCAGRGLTVEMSWGRRGVHVSVIVSHIRVHGMRNAVLMKLSLLSWKEVVMVSREDMLLLIVVIMMINHLKCRSDGRCGEWARSHEALLMLSLAKS